MLNWDSEILNHDEAGEVWSVLYRVELGAYTHRDLEDVLQAVPDAVGAREELARRQAMEED